MYRSFVSLVRIRVACRRGRRCGRQRLPRFRLRRYEIIRNLRMPDRARSTFLLKNLKYLGRVRLDSVRTRPAALAGRKDMASAGFDASRHSRPVRRFLLPVEREGARRPCPAVRAVLGEVPVVSDMTGYGVPAPWLGRSLAVRKWTVLRTVAGRIKKVVPSWEIRINLCNFVMQGRRVVSCRSGLRAARFVLPKPTDR